VKPSKPVKTTTVPVKTGDDTNIIMMVIGGLLSAAVLAYLLIRHAMKA
ncbi:LPXTG cell wall anchor domain-containing protein, partial [Kandleria sp.]|nr:LPXTG cell wall anchor domain-containing protein [Kandleria sp.]